MENLSSPIIDKLNQLIIVVHAYAKASLTEDQKTIYFNELTKSGLNVTDDDVIPFNDES